MKMNGIKQANEKIEIVAFPRIHITLIGMNKGGYRVNGGIGFSIDSPQITATASVSDSFIFIDNRLTVLDEKQMERLKSVIDEVFATNSFRNNISVEIRGNFHTHSGLGSGTIVRLMCLEALYILNDMQYDEKLLVKLSGRGGTSGIGIRSYFSGGFVFDIGHKYIDQDLLPSSQLEKSSNCSLLLENISMPNWEIGLCFPDSAKLLNESEEKEFFLNTLPISDNDVYKALYHATYGVYGAIKENDKSVFEAAINNIQHLNWKASERNLYGNIIHEYEMELFRSGAKSVGMSSLGPCLFFTAQSVSDVIDSFLKGGKKCVLLKTNPNNTGRIITR